MFANRGVLLFAVGGLLLVAAALAIFSQGGSAAAPSPAPAPVAPVTQAVVFVAATDLDAGSTITTTQVLTAAYPVALVPADAITQTADLAGHVTTAPIFGGQILVHRQFAGVGAGGVAIPAGKLMVAVPATDMLNATGAIRPGDHVDLLVSVPISSATALDALGQPGGLTVPATGGGRLLTTQSTLQDIEVAAVGFPSEANVTNVGGVSANIKVISCLVSHQQALVLKFVKDSGGSIDFAMRSPRDQQQIATDPVTINYLTNTYDFQGGTPVPGNAKGTVQP